MITFDAGQACLFVLSDYPNPATTNNADNVSATNAPLFWFPVEQLSSSIGENISGQLALPTIASREIDRNTDGRPDELKINVQLRFGSRRRITAVFYAFYFDIKLDLRAIVEVFH